MTRQIWQLRQELIGIDVGRAFGRSGKIMKLKKLEYPEPWEREYQAVRNMRDDVKLANFLGDNLAPLLKPFEADVIVIGGGLTEHRGFLQALRNSFKAHGTSVPFAASAAAKTQLPSAPPCSSKTKGERYALGA